MNSGELSRPGPLASQPLARKGAQSGHGSRARLKGNRPQTCAVVQHHELSLSMEQLNNETPIITCEIFKEDVSYRAQSRKFLWEFFD